MGGKRKKLKLVEEKHVGQNSNRAPKKDNCDNKVLTYSKIFRSLFEFGRHVFLRHT